MTEIEDLLFPTIRTGMRHLGRLVVGMVFWGTVWMTVVSALFVAVVAIAES